MGPLTAASTWLAQTWLAQLTTDVGEGDDAPGDPGTVDGDIDVLELPGQGAARSVSEQVAEAMPNDLLASVVKATLVPALQILLILVLASLVLTFARRVIARTVAHAKDPDATQGPLRRRRPADEGPSYAIRRAQRADALGALLTSVVTVVVWVLAGFLVLAEVGVNLAPLVAGAGVVGLAVGFGAQDLVKDFLSGVFMLAEDQFGVGDIVDVGEAAGVVEGVTLRTTKIRDVEGTLWHVPNGEIRRVGNSSQQWARSLLDIGVAYGTDIDTAIEVIEAVAGAMAEEDGYRDQFLDAPDVWGVQSLGADSVDIRLVIKTEPGAQWAISRELRRRLKAAFDAVGIEIPFPQRTMWVRDETDRQEPAPLDAAAIERAVASARTGDRGAERVLAQDENAVAVDVEEELAEDVGASPAADVPR
ncbi:mechanosensitive ion channel family protein [Nitriliruptor alkaliphilus]|uniref:mechanosensitive ion channel family protein n=1 Tax=Nitriliruptor alkaliphilus TaxID=427918 RepID=UPI0006965EEB|nr:mechanosensitive ion channel family protein [Nitriliruptor alkaliphilus]